MIRLAALLAVATVAASCSSADQVRALDILDQNTRGVHEVVDVLLKQARTDTAASAARVERLRGKNAKVRDESLLLIRALKRYYGAVRPAGDGP